MPEGAWPAIHITPPADAPTTQAKRCSNRANGPSSFRQGCSTAPGAAGLAVGGVTVSFPQTDAISVGKRPKSTSRAGGRDVHAEWGSRRMIACLRPLYALHHALQHPETTVSALELRDKGEISKSIKHQIQSPL